MWNKFFLKNKGIQGKKKKNKTTFSIIRIEITLPKMLPTKKPIENILHTA